MVLQAVDVEGEEAVDVVVILEWTEQAGEPLLDQVGVGYNVYGQLEDDCLCFSYLRDLLWYYSKWSVLQPCSCSFVFVVLLLFFCNLFILLSLLG